MGVDLFVFSPREAILTSEELRRELRARGWEVRFVIDQPKLVLEPAAEGPLTEFLDVIGWPTASDQGARIAEALDRRDLTRFQALYDEGAAGTCGFSVVSDFVFADDFDEDEFDGDAGDPDDETEPIDAECLEAIKRARTKYCLRVRARSSNRSFEFMNIVWEAIGRLKEGILMDPQLWEVRRAE